MLPKIVFKHLQQACADRGYGHRPFFQDILVALDNERIPFKGHSVKKAEDDLSP
jgi:hypothetical protein